MSRINEIIRRVEQREVIDLDQELMLCTLKFARQGERFAEEMIALIESLDETHRYSGVDEIDLYESGQVKAIRFRKPNVDSNRKEPANRANDREK